MKSMLRFVLAFVGLIGLARFPQASANAVVTMSKQKLEEHYWAVYLSRIVYFHKWIKDHQKDMKNYNGVSFDRLDFWLDEPDASLVAKISGINVCYAIYRGTNKNINDWIQNIHPDTVKVGQCKAHKGYWHGIANSYRSKMETAMDQCLTACPSCRLIIGGHSQGGAISAIASIVYKKYNPEVVTVGATKGVHLPCRDVNPKNHYRYINIKHYDAGNFYDIAVMATLMGADHIGQPLIMAGDKYITTLPFGNQDKRLMYSLLAHPVEPYEQRFKEALAAYKKKPGSTVTFRGRSNNHRCGYGDECATGRCEGYIPPFKCEARVGVKSSCNEDSDCTSNKCSWRGAGLKCVLSNGKMPDGGACNVDSNCVSGRCEGWSPTTRECEAKLRNGKSCNEDSDCQSNNCRWSWSGRKCK